ncbi:hypothetical protein HY745_10065, partial [Candidatus Desantisbacteria bacterium]|nr:hypothetical protein [Candidatus Desantisbacteria bacterium]
MIKINLLPKESKKVTAFNKLFLAGIILSILILVSLSGIYYYFYDQANILTKRIEILDDEISKIDK